MRKKRGKGILSIDFKIKPTDSCIYFLSRNPFVLGSTKTPNTAAITEASKKGFPKIPKILSHNKLQFVKVSTLTPAAEKTIPNNPNMKKGFLKRSLIFIKKTLLSDKKKETLIKNPL